jgi:hypothetical protein
LMVWDASGGDPLRCEKPQGPIEGKDNAGLVADAEPLPVTAGTNMK